MQCGVCGHKNAVGAVNCASCGVSLGFSAKGVLTGGITDSETPNNVYNHYLDKGVHLRGGNYAIGGVLGQGGFGITYKGGDLSLRRYVAIKEFFPPGCVRRGSTVIPTGTLSSIDYTSIKAKFIEEARTLARFSDPGIVRVFGVFEENNTAYMVMEFLEGKTLAKLLQERGSVPEKEMVAYAQALGDALATVHEANLIHRDVKPDNIVVTTKGRVVLIDFGTARQFTSGKTVRQTALLTADYAPLEQYSNQARFGPYSDIYALGATLYHCLTGQVPPQATDRVSGVELKAPDQVNPYVSRTVSDAVQWAMKIQASDRPQNIREFVAALQSRLPNDNPQPDSDFDVLLELDSWQPIGTALVPTLPSKTLPIPPAKPLHPPAILTNGNDRRQSAISICATIGGISGAGITFSLDPMGYYIGYFGLFVAFLLGFCLGGYIGWKVEIE